MKNVQIFMGNSMLLFKRQYVSIDSKKRHKRMLLGRSLILPEAV